MALGDDLLDAAGLNKNGNTGGLDGFRGVDPNDLNGFEEVDRNTFRDQVDSAIKEADRRRNSNKLTEEEKQRDPNIPSNDDIRLQASNELFQLLPTEDPRTPEGTPDPDSISGIGKALSSIGEGLKQPGVQQALAQFGIALSGNREGSAGTILGNAALDQVNTNAERRVTQELLAGKDIQDINLSGLSGAGLERALRRARAQDQLDLNRDRNDTFQQQVDQQKTRDENIATDREAQRAAAQEEVAREVAQQESFRNALAQIQSGTSLKELDLSEANLSSRQLSELQDFQQSIFDESTQDIREKTSKANFNLTSLKVKLARQELQETVNSSGELTPEERQEAFDSLAESSREEIKNINERINDIENRRGDAIATAGGGLSDEEVKAIREKDNKEIAELESRKQFEQSVINIAQRAKLPGSDVKFKLATFNNVDSVRNTFDKTNSNSFIIIQETPITGTDENGNPVTVQVPPLILQGSDDPEEDNFLFQNTEREELVRNILSESGIKLPSSN